MTNAIEKQKHPTGIYTLFLTEMWERMSFYGLKVILILYMVDQTRGGKGYNDETGLAIFGLYTALVYVSALPGGWIGDRLLGAKRGVWWGGLAIAIGHLMLAVPGDAWFFGGLIIIAFGSGVLKPNISVMVAQLYPEGGARRDSGFTLLYMGINLGALIGQIVCSNLAEHQGWSWGFSAAAAGMGLGLLQFQLSKKHVAGIGDWKLAEGQNVRNDWTRLIVAGAFSVIVFIVFTKGWLPFDAVTVSQYTSIAIAVLALVFYIWIFMFNGLTPIEKKRVAVSIILFIAAVIFFAGFAQGGAAFLLFAERYTIREVGGFTIAAGTFIALNAIFIVAFSPLVSMLWDRLSKRGIEPMLATKFALGLLFLAGSFLLGGMAATRALESGPVWPVWLVGIFAFKTLGELFLSPVGLSAVTKLAPERLASRMMGVWFMAASLGYVLSGLIAGKITADNAGHMPGRFYAVFICITIAGLLLLACARLIQKLIPGVK